MSDSKRFEAGSAQAAPRTLGALTRSIVLCNAHAPRWLDGVIAAFRSTMLGHLRAAIEFEQIFGIDVSSLRQAAPATEKSGGLKKSASAKVAPS